MPIRLTQVVTELTTPRIPSNLCQPDRHGSNNSNLTESPGKAGGFRHVKNPGCLLLFNVCARALLGAQFYLLTPLLGCLLKERVLFGLGQVMGSIAPHMPSRVQ